MHGTLHRLPGGAGPKRVPKGKKGAGQAFSLGRWAPRDRPDYTNKFYFL